MMINSKTAVYFDLESTGFSGFEDKFVSGYVINGNTAQDFLEWEEGLDALKRLMRYFRQIGDFGTLVTYNGENWKGGFDIPFLRSQCLKHNIKWTLKGMDHLDLLPLVRKRISTHHYIEEVPSSSNLYKKDLVKIAKANSLEYTNKTETYNQLLELENCNWLDYIKNECKEENGLQAIYQLIFDPKKEEDYLTGGDVPKLYENEEYDKIYKHNKLDVIRLKKVTEAIIGMIPDYEIQKAITTL